MINHNIWKHWQPQPSLTTSLEVGSIQVIQACGLRKEKSNKHIKLQLNKKFISVIDLGHYPELEIKTLGKGQYWKQHFN